MANIKEVDEKTFQSEVLESNIPVLVDFWAPWCGPCQMVTPMLEAVAEKMGDKLKVVKMNTDENMNTAQNYQIMAIPSLLVFKKGEVVERIVGVQPQPQLEAQLQEIITS
ncbi:MAG: thioredoxin [Candidatus Aminicenantes bacterium]|nr:MAG: thioredoxin [Candidatus Aminicenantes bacterium]